MTTMPRTMTWTASLPEAEAVRRAAIVSRLVLFLLFKGNNRRSTAALQRRRARPRLTRKSLVRQLV
jgi:hypothetical protein